MIPKILFDYKGFAKKYFKNIYIAKIGEYILTKVAISAKIN